MAAVDDLIGDVERELASRGLILRGGFAFEQDEDAPAGPAGAPALAALLVGQRGAEPWPHFQQWLQRQSGTVANPLDTWSREIIASVARRFGARAVSPSDKPYLPFQQWAMRAEGLRPSPLGILMHPDYGLWHAYRGALLFDTQDAAAAIAGMNQHAHIPIHLCDRCDGKPCLKSCPVDAYDGRGFNYADCLSHVRSEQGRPCRDDGCLDRNACPYGLEWRYPADVQRFHMAAFASL